VKVNLVPQTALAHGKTAEGRGKNQKKIKGQEKGWTGQGERG